MISRLNIRWRFGLVLSFMLVAALSEAEPMADSKSAWPGKAGERAWTDLAVFYKDTKATLPGQDAVSDLSSPDSGVAREAGDYLAALFAQAQADEVNGRSEWRLITFWGVAESRARNFREQLACALSKKASGAAALPAVGWLLEHERLPSAQEAACDVLLRIHTPEADALLCQLIAQSHPNAYVLQHAVEEVGRRKLHDASQTLERLCGHYRKTIRDAAAGAMASLGRGCPATPLPEEEFTPKLEQDLRSIVAMIFPVLPAGAKWAWFEKKEHEGSALVEVPALGAWILSERETTTEVLTYFGSHEFLAKAEYTGVIEPMTTTALRLIRTPAGPHLSRMGMLTAQFEPGSVPIPVALVSAWLLEAGKRREAAELLFPLLDKLSDDRWLLTAARDQVGGTLHREMLSRFCGARDYAKAEAIARHLSGELFSGYCYQDRARELSVQLPERRGDFTTLVLPSASDWPRLQATMDRPTRIRFLAERIRLLNCRQRMQPGGISYRDKQYALPRETGGEVINPYVELLAMDLAPADIKLLLPYLSDQSFILAFSYWRNFSPDRDLHRVSTVITSVINAVVPRPPVDLQALAALTGAEREQRLAVFSQWCDERAATDLGTLALETIRTESDWSIWKRAVVMAIVEKRGEQVVSEVLARQDRFPTHEAEIAALLYEFHTPRTLPWATHWTRHNDREALFWATLTVLEQGGGELRSAALSVLAKVLSRDLDVELYALAIDPLLKIATPEATDLATGILRHSRFSSCMYRPEILHRLMLAGRPEAFDYARFRLDDHVRAGSSSGEWEGKRVERELYGFDTVAEWATRWRLGWSYSIVAPEALRQEKVDELKQWLSAQAEAVRNGKKPDINPAVGTPIARVHSTLDAP